jgi:hypothetical protein
MSTITLQYALDILEKLPYEEQEMVIDIVKKRHIEDRRDEISRNAADLNKSIKDGTACHGTLDDLKNDLLSD